MAERKTSEELKKICDKYKVDTLWSWSRYNTYKTDSYSYYLKYVKNIKEDRKDSIYSVSGGYCHDILEKYYNGTINQIEMINEYEDSLMLMAIADYKYDRTDDDKNELIANKYENCIKHFFRHHKKSDNINILLELFCTAQISEDIIFQGYIDNCDIINDNGKRKIIITDYKTSTIYKGEKLEKESGQLYLYAEAVRQKTKLSLDDIQIRYLFLKYVNVKYQQANGAWKERQIERNQIGNKLASTATMWLKKLGYNPDDYINDVILYNSIESLPDNVKEKFIIGDCYIYLPLTQERIDNLKTDIIKTITEINNKTKQYNDSGDDKIFWTDVTEKNEYFLAVLSGYSRNLHKPFNEYLKAKEMYNIENNDIDNELAELLENL